MGKRHDKNLRIGTFYIPKTAQTTVKKLKIRNLLTYLDPDLKNETDLGTLLDKINNLTKAKI